MTRNMTTGTILTVHLPKSMYDQLKEMASSEGISMNQFVMLAVGEKMATLTALAYLEERGKRGSREKYLEILAKAPDIEPPDERDRI